MSRYLLDTQVFLWWCANDPQLGQRLRQVIETDETRILVSVVSAWEIVLKNRAGKLDWPFSDDVRENVSVTEIVERCGFDKLPMSFDHAEQLRLLPQHHNDPFDHMLITQALVEGLTLISHDRVFRRYDVPVLWA